MKRKYSTPRMIGEQFQANEYVSACYTIACKVGDGAYNPVTQSTWPITEAAGVYHASSGTENCHDSNANYITADGAGVMTALKEWRGDMKKFLEASNIKWVDRDGDGKVSTGDYFSWDTSAGTKTWHHWGYAAMASEAHPNRS